jgi:hypothetical protein
MLTGRVLWELMPKQSLSTAYLASVYRRTAVVLALLAGVVWLAAGGAAPVRVSDPLAELTSLESTRPSTKALHAQAGPAWRETRAQRSYSGRTSPNAKAALQPSAHTLVTSSAIINLPAIPQCISQFFLSCRTRNPRDPPLA